MNLLCFVNFLLLVCTSFIRLCAIWQIWLRTMHCMLKTIKPLQKIIPTLFYIRTIRMWTKKFKTTDNDLKTLTMKPFEPDKIEVLTYRSVKVFNPVLLKHYKSIYFLSLDTFITCKNIFPKPCLTLLTEIKIKYYNI